MTQNTQNLLRMGNLSIGTESESSHDKSVSAHCRHLMEALVKADDFSSIVKNSHVDVDVDELKSQAFEYVSSLEKVEIESYLSAAEYLQSSYFDTSTRRSGRDQ